MSSMWLVSMNLSSSWAVSSVAEQRKLKNDSIPVLRFEGFTDPWEQRRLGEVALITMGQSPNGAMYTDNPSDAILVQGNADLRNGWVRPRIWTKEITKEAKAGSLIFSVRAPVGEVGKTAYDVVLGRGVAGIQGSEFIFQLLKRLQDRSYWATVSAGSTFDSVDRKTLVGTNIMVPIQETEQFRIGALFAKLDSLIALHQRKHEKLKAVKQSLLGKMFPKEGKSVPEIRFEGFTDPWEQRRFAEFVTQSGARNKENLPLESYSVSNDRGFVPQDEQFENGGTMREADKSAYWIVEPGSFAYNPARINVGSIGYQSTSGNVIVSSLYEVFKSDETCDDRFLWHWFKSPLFMRQIEMLQEGGVRLYFFFDKLLKSEIWMPCVGEQLLIGGYFDKFDSLIALHQREFCHLRFKHLRQLSPPPTKTNHLN